LIQAGRTMPRTQALPLEREEFANLFDTEDQTEGVSAFLNKRKAVWKNG
jgi:enoyl-CoA hydratase/carnithine racemase